MCTLLKFQQDNPELPKVKEDQAILETPTTTAEIYKVQAKSSMQTGKAPCPDGCPTQFFHISLSMLAD